MVVYRRRRSAAWTIRLSKGVRRSGIYVPGRKFPSRIILLRVISPVVKGYVGLANRGNLPGSLEFTTASLRSHGHSLWMVMTSVGGSQKDDRTIDQVLRSIRYVL